MVQLSREEASKCLVKSAWSQPRRSFHSGDRGELRSGSLRVLPSLTMAVHFALANPSWPQWLGLTPTRSWGGPSTSRFHKRPPVCPAQVGKFLSFIIFVINVFEREGKGMKGKPPLTLFQLQAICFVSLPYPGEGIIVDPHFAK